MTDRVPDPRTHHSFTCPECEYSDREAGCYATEGQYLCGKCLSDGKTVRITRSVLGAILYEDEMTTVWHGDNQHIIPWLIQEGVQVDLVLTDPPYNVSHINGPKGETAGRLPKGVLALGHERILKVQHQMDLGGEVATETVIKRGTTGRPIVKRFGDWDFDFSAKAFVDRVFPLVREGGQLIAFTSEFLMPDWLDTPFKHRALLFWEKSNPTPSLPRFYTRPIEIAVWQTKGKNWTFTKGGYCHPIYRVPSISGGSMKSPGETRVHPTQKPQELARKILQVHAKPGDLVLDPFGGSGSFGRAAKDLGMRVIIIEADEEYAKHAANLMRQTVLPMF